MLVVHLACSTVMVFAVIPSCILHCFLNSLIFLLYAFLPPLLSSLFHSFPISCCSKPSFLVIFLLFSNAIPSFPYLFLLLSFVSSSLHSALKPSFLLFLILHFSFPFSPHFFIFFPHPFHSSCLHTFILSFTLKHHSFYAFFVYTFVIFLSRSIFPSFTSSFIHPSSCLIQSFVVSFHTKTSLQSFSVFIPLSFPLYTLSFLLFFVLSSLAIILH